MTDPQYVYSDTKMFIPDIGSALEFLIELAADRGYLPSHLMDRYVDGWAAAERRGPPLQTFSVPSAVTSTLTRGSIQLLQPLATQNVAAQVYYVKVNRRKCDAETALAIENVFASSSNHTPSLKKCLFRGLPLGAVQASLRLLHAVHTTTSAMEFGPGVYVTLDLSDAVTYGANGGILVFNLPDHQRLKVVSPTLADWKQIVKTNITREGTLPPSVMNVDVINGPMATNYEDVKNNRDPMHEDAHGNVKNQSVYCSHTSIMELARELIGVIYLV